MKILCCADIHMGRIPSVPYLEGLSSHSSWDAIVEKALSLAVDVLVLAGDVVEQEEYWFEAYGPLLSGLVKLGDAGIQVIGVGGNHDYSVFPQLAKENHSIKLLGMGGVWEHFDYKGVRFVGWSFPQRHMKENPLDSFDREVLDTNLPLLGVLHCDVGSSVFSSYAPVPKHAFFQTSIPWWVLGHIHIGEILPQSNAFYCGSPYALSSKEEGLHGLWLLEREAQGPWKNPQRIPLCPYRFETCTVNLEGAKSEEDVRTKLTQSLREFAKSLLYEGTLLCKLILVGRIDRSLDISKILTREHMESLWIDEEACKVHPLPSIVDNTFLDIDLENLRAGKDAIALLANKLLEEHALQQMAQNFKRLDEESFNARPFQSLDQRLKSDEEYLHLAREAAKRLLYSMINSSQGDRV